MPLSYPHAILFDLDGTLADTAPDLAEAVNQLRIKRDLLPAPYEHLRVVASAGARGLIGTAFGIAPGHDNYETLRTEFLENYIASIAVKTRLFDGVTELLEGLIREKLQWGIVTNKAARLTDMLVPKIGLQHAGCVISGDTTAHPKPHPDPLIEAAKQLGVRPQDCWYVGDDIRDIQAGRAAGMITVAAEWGYCGDSLPVTWGADAIAATPHALLQMIVSRQT